MASTSEETVDRLLQHRRFPGQITIGLGGGSGSGKSTIAATIEEGLQPGSIEVVGLCKQGNPRTWPHAPNV